MSLRRESYQENRIFLRLRNKNTLQSKKDNASIISVEKKTTCYLETSSSIQGT